MNKKKLIDETVSIVNELFGDYKIHGMEQKGRKEIRKEINKTLEKGVTKVELLSTFKKDYDNNGDYWTNNEMKFINELLS